MPIATERYVERKDVSLGVVYEISTQLSLVKCGKAARRMSLCNAVHLSLVQSLPASSQTYRMLCHYSSDGSKSHPLRRVNIKGRAINISLMILLFRKIYLKDIVLYPTQVKPTFNMTQLIAPYSVAEYNSVPDFKDVAPTFQDQQGVHFVETVIKDLIVQHGLNDIFGVALLHSHFPLADGQLLVELNNVSVPWKVKKLSVAGVATYMGGEIHPTSWLLTKQDQLMPYEFSFSGADKPSAIELNDEQYQVFLQKFIAALKAANMQQIVALKLVPEVDTDGAMEVTQGNANILHLRGTVSYRRA